MSRHQQIVAVRNLAIYVDVRVAYRVQKIAASRVKLNLAILCATLCQHILPYHVAAQIAILNVPLKVTPQAGVDLTLLPRQYGSCIVLAGRTFLLQPQEAAINCACRDKRIIVNVVSILVIADLTRDERCYTSWIECHRIHEL